MNAAHALPDDEKPSSDRPVDLSLDYNDVAQAQSLGLLLWGAMLIGHFHMGFAAVWYIMVVDAAPTDLAHQWFYIVACMVAATLVPASFHLRSKVFKKFWDGGVVSPREFVIGSVLPWVALTISAMIGWLGVLHAHSLVPSFVVPASMVIVMLILYPTGDAMRLPVGKLADTDKFKHPY